MFPLLKEILSQSQACVLFIDNANVSRCSETLPGLGMWRQYVEQATSNATVIVAMVMEGR
jgi:hypothetical protein